MGCGVGSGGGNGQAANREHLRSVSGQPPEPSGLYAGVSGLVAAILSFFGAIILSLIAETEAIEAGRIGRRLFPDPVCLERVAPGTHPVVREFVLRVRGVCAPGLL